MYRMCNVFAGLRQMSKFGIHTHTHIPVLWWSILLDVLVRMAVAHFETQLFSTASGMDAVWPSTRDLPRDFLSRNDSSPRPATRRPNPAVERVKGAVHPGIPPPGNQLRGFKSHGRRPAFYRSPPPTVEISATVLHLFMKISLRSHYRVSSQRLF